METVARVGELKTQANSLASSNLALSSDKVVLEARLEETLQSLSAKKKTEKALEEHLAQAEQMLAGDVIARQDFEEKAVSGFIKGYQYAQYELLEKDPEFEDSWMSLEFDKEALLDGDEKEDEEGEGEEEEGGEVKEEQEPAGGSEGSEAGDHAAPTSDVALSVNETTPDVGAEP